MSDAREVQVRGARIRYDDLGAGEPALFCVPGWCEPRTGFREVAGRLARRRRVLVMDVRGHGESTMTGDFGFADVAADAAAVIEQSGATRIVPVTISHAGWVAIELRRRLAERVAKLVLLDWIVLAPPPEFLAALEGLQDAQTWEATREQLFSMWLAGAGAPPLVEHIRGEMGAFGFEMWQRAAREIAAAYRASETPVAALAALTPPVPTLHLYSQPKDEGLLAAQRDLTVKHPWFRVGRLSGRTHFPALETPDELVEALEPFVAA